VGDGFQFGYSVGETSFDHGSKGTLMTRDFLTADPADDTDDGIWRAVAQRYAAGRQFGDRMSNCTSLLLFSTVQRVKVVVPA
jgi:hypothetical protein